MWYRATHVLAGELPTGDVALFFAYVTNSYNPMRAVPRSSYLFNQSSVGTEIMSVRREVTDRAGARQASRLKRGIEFRDVSFEYQAGRPALSHINLAIASGKKVSIVGATGAGKGTLVSLIPRFYDPTYGEICIDGEDLGNDSVPSLRGQISLVLQDSLLFSARLRENIAFGFPDASDAAIVAAAGRTALIIAHRLTTVRLADRIIVLDQGRILEEGTHVELLAGEGRYAQFYELQIANNAAAVERTDYK